MDYRPVRGMTGRQSRCASHTLRWHECSPAVDAAAADAPGGWACSTAAPSIAAQALPERGREQNCPLLGADVEGLNVEPQVSLVAVTTIKSDASRARWGAPKPLLKSHF
jgi:hypothetical protein